MASVSCVFSVDFKEKRRLSLINVKESFADVVQKFTTDVCQYCLSCSVDGCGWTSLIPDVSLLYLIFCRDLDP